MNPRIAFIIGYGGSMIPALVKALSKVREKYKFEYTIASSTKIKDYLEELKKANVILIYSQRLIDDVEELLKELKAKTKIIGVDENHVQLTNTSMDTFTKASRLLRLGGSKNLESLVLLLLKEAGYKDIVVPEPEDIPWHGIYHPKLGLYASTKEYLEKYPYSNRSLVGILFYRNDWLYGRTIIVDKLVEKLEAQGLGVIPVFTYGFRDKRLNIPGSEDSIREFFLVGGKPVIDLLINLTSFFLLDHGRSREWATKGYSIVGGIELLKKLNVPVIQALVSYSMSSEDWWKSERGVDYMTIVYRIAMPEVDGVIEPIMIAGTKLGNYGEKVFEPIDEQIDYLVERVKQWIKLKHKKPYDRRIAIILINPPCKGLEANVAVGLGLDVPESIVKLLWKLKEQGYNVGDYLPRNGEELVKLILERRAISEFRWTSVDEIVSRGGALDFVDEDTYLRWFNELPEDVKKKIIQEWGNPVDVLEGRVDKVLVGMVYKGKFVIPGLRFGNIVIIPQPKRGCAGPRCDGRVCKILHDPTIPPPHQWLAVYRWITRVFKADVIVHFGTHGYMEFLPGKSVGLSPSCWPQITLDHVPHVYVYVVSNPMEGVIAKRRGYAVIIDHLYPPLKQVDTLSDLEDLINQYTHAVNMGDNVRAETVYKQLLEKIREHNITVPENASKKEVIETIHRYVHAVRSTHVNMGLHVLGSPPDNPRRLAEYVFTIISSTDNSPQKTISWILGISYEELKKNPLGFNEKYKLVNNELRRRIDNTVLDILEKLLSKNLDNRALGMLIREELRKQVNVAVEDDMLPKVIESFRYTLNVAENIRRSSQELENLIKTFSSSYIEPGASGPLTRGRIEVLPTGRNFYLIDPRTLPTKAAWLVGKESAKKLIEYYRRKHGRYPETIGQVLWSIDAYKADGEQLAQILYLIGVEPVWDENGVVKDLRVIPLEELGRPRIDVVVRISGIVRDTLPNYIELIDKAIAKVIQLDEPLDKNYVRKHYVEALKELLRLGVKEGEARRKARYRIYGAPPGAYGAGVNLAVEASAWKTELDLAKTWIQWSGYAYSIDAQGEPAHDSLVIQLRNVDLVNRNHVSDEHDILGCCCYFAYHGGFYNTVKALTRKKDLEIVTTDTRDPSLVEVRSIKLEIERTVRARLLNKEWIKEMKKHGYSGANEFQRKILHLYGWASTSRMVDNWVFNEIAKIYVLDDEMRQWFLEHNKWALEEITRRLIEAAFRGIWSPPKELLDKLQEIYNEIEGHLEEDITVPSNIQGGSIDILISSQVKSWKDRIKEIEELIEKFMKRT